MKSLDTAAVRSSAFFGVYHAGRDPGTYRQCENHREDREIDGRHPPQPALEQPARPRERHQ